MCLHTKKRYWTWDAAEACALMTKDDITVYKVLSSDGDNEVLESPSRSFRYLPGITYTGRLEVMVCTIYRFFGRRYMAQVTDGFHAYTSYGTALMHAPKWTRCFISRTRRARIFRCTIPRGAHYVVGSEGDIASDKLVVHDEIMNKNHFIRLAMQELAESYMNKTNQVNARSSATS